MKSRKSLRAVLGANSVRKSKKNLELELCTRFKAGELSAFIELSRIYEKLLLTVAEKYLRQGLARPELVLYAKIGLLKAAHRYDDGKMVSFRLYAIWWMRQCITKALKEQSRIEMIPEMLIKNLQEILQSFHTKEEATVIDSADFLSVVRDEIQVLEKNRRS